MAATTMKVCTVCNKDCSALPRVKDEFNRYTCRACMDAKVQASNTAAVHDNDELGNLRAAAQMEAKSNALDLPESQSCPRCHGFLPDAARLCMRCGFDRKRGAKVITRIEKVKETKEKSARARAGQSPLIAVIACWIVGGIPVAVAMLGFFGPVYKTIGVEAAIITSLLAVAIILSKLLTVTVFQFVDGYSGYGFGTIGAFVCAFGAAIAAVSGVVLGGAAILVALVFLIMAIVLFVRTVLWAMSITERGWLRVLGTCYGIYLILSVSQIFLAGFGAIERPYPPGWMDGDDGVAAAAGAPLRPR